LSKNHIPQATAKRLPLYYRFINNLSIKGTIRDSSKELSDNIKINTATIKRDFSYFGATSKNRNGDNVEYLLEFFKKTLDQDELTKVTLIGVGNLGTAFINYNFTRNNNNKIVKAFDRSTNKSVKEIGGMPIYHIDELAEELNDVEIAILTVPQAEAQEITNKLVAQGIKGILN